MYNVQMYIYDYVQKGNKAQLFEKWRIWRCQSTSNIRKYDLYDRIVIFM